LAELEGSRPTVHIVGLGPGDVDLLTTGTRQLLESGMACFGRTERHPAAAAFPHVTWFDEVYEQADRLDQVYLTITDRVVAEATMHSEVVYAVPGSPLVAEQTVQMLLSDERVQCHVVPAMSFLEVAWTALGIDPIAVGVTVVDGHRFAEEVVGATAPLLVCQCDSSLVLSDIKLSVDEWPEEPVVLIARLGLPDQVVREVPWEELDRSVEADHLTSLYIPKLGTTSGRELMQFDELVHTLRSGCPWDREQTHESLRRYLLEECYELVDAIDRLDPENDASIDHFCEELGDVLFQVFLHSAIADEEGWFTLADVTSMVHDKLYNRHPHVFSDAPMASPEELALNWETIKAAERAESGRSGSDVLPDALPALLYAAKVHKKREANGSASPDLESIPVLTAAALRPDGTVDGDALGALVFAVVGLARAAGVDTESALRTAAKKAYAAQV
jgi:tetrapyrrole methylase family protein/MazG family protein